MLKLVIRTGSQAGMEFPTDQPVVRIGRGSGNDVVLQDTQSSRQHAEITRQGDQLFIRDLGSTNGTFVNGERVTAPRLLKSGDQIRIGETTLSCQITAMAAVPTAGADWESQLWTEQEAAPAAGRKKLLVWGLVGLVAVLLVAAAIVAFVVLGGGKGTPTPVAMASPETSASAGAIVVAPTATPEPTIETQPTATPLVQLPTTEPLPSVTVAVQPTVKPPSPPKPPTTGMPISPGELEQLPAMVTEILGNVPPEQLPEAIAAQIQQLPQDQLQAMIGALFPGVSPDKLIPVVAASFPQLSQGDLQGLLNMVFPGQNIQVPEAGPIGGRLALSIYDKASDRHNLYLANAMGGQPTLLLEQAGEPDFAPDGQWLVYFSWNPDRMGLRLIKTDGSGDTQLTTISDDGYPTFSPNGQRISFFNHVHSTLHVINRDGIDRRDIGKGEYPAWSPTGDQIVYRGCVGGGKCGLIVSNTDGSNPRQITTHANDAAPRWSPNGGQIVFHSDRDGNWEIYVINSDGSWLRRITMSPATDIMPVWSPDGLRVAFRSDRGGKGAVWVTSGIGGAATKLFDAEFSSKDWLWAQMDWGK